MYGLTWVGFFLGLAIGVALLGSLVGSPSFIVVASLASTLLLVAGFFVSIYFSFAVSFVADFASGDDHAA